MLRAWALSLRETAAVFPPPTRASPAAPSLWRFAPDLRGSSPCHYAARRAAAGFALALARVGGFAADTCGAWAEFPLDPLPPGAASLRPATGGPRSPWETVAACETGDGVYSGAGNEI